MVHLRNKFNIPSSSSSLTIAIKIKSKENTRKAALLLFYYLKVYHLNTLRTGDADLRLYITTVQDG
jgi:hypothetical protein